jgi:hypothetical protein
MFLERNEKPSSPRYDTITQDTCMGTVEKPIHVSCKTMTNHSRDMTVQYYQPLNVTLSSGILIKCSLKYHAVNFQVY